SFREQVGNSLLTHSSRWRLMRHRNSGYGYEFMTHPTLVCPYENQSLHRGSIYNDRIHSDESYTVSHQLDRKPCPTCIPWFRLIREQVRDLDFGNATVLIVECSGILRKERDYEIRGVFLEVLDQCGNPIRIKRFERVHYDERERLVEIMDKVACERENQP